MALVTLPNLYCVPNDLFDFLGIDGGQLRADDNGLATGQTIIATADAPANATTIPCTALQWALLNGSVLEFLGSGMPATVEVKLSALALTGSTSLQVQPLSAQVNNLAYAVDNGNNLATAQRLTLSCQRGTAKVKLYCCGRYDDSQLCQSWSVNQWALACAAYWYSTRRSQSAPKAIKDQYDEALEELKAVQKAELWIEDIGTRTSGWPFITNSTVNIAYDIAKSRVEPSISEGTPTVYPQYVDWNSYCLLEY